MFLCLCPSYHYYYSACSRHFIGNFIFPFREEQRVDKKFTAGLTDVKKMWLKMPIPFEAIIVGLPIWFGSSKNAFLDASKIKCLGKASRGTQSKWFVYFSGLDLENILFYLYAK